MMLSLLNISLQPACLLGVLCLLTLQKVAGLSYRYDSKSYEDHTVPRAVLPLKFPGHLFVSVTTPFNARTSDHKENNGFEGVDESVVTNFIDEFLQERYLDLMKDEIVSHYAKNRGKPSSFLPFDVESLTKYDIESGLLNYDNDRRYRVCESCAPGHPGLSGNPGTPGMPGPFGDKGNLGPRGDQGDLGVKGEGGARPKGEKGGKGHKGIKGELGEDGSKGLKGRRHKGRKGNWHHGPPGVNNKGRKGLKGERSLCCNPGLYERSSDKCYFFIEDEASYGTALEICQSHASTAQILQFTSSTQVGNLDRLINFRDEAGTNIWSYTPTASPSGNCNMWSFSTNTIVQVLCAFPNDFVCYYTSTVCPPPFW